MQGIHKARGGAGASDHAGLGQARYAHLFNETILQATKAVTSISCGLRGRGDGTKAVMPANAGHPLFRADEIEPISRGVLDHPPSR